MQEKIKMKMDFGFILSFSMVFPEFISDFFKTGWTTRFILILIYVNKYKRDRKCDVELKDVGCFSPFTPPWIIMNVWMMIVHMMLIWYVNWLWQRYWMWNRYWMRYSIRLRNSIRNWSINRYWHNSVNMYRIRFWIGDMNL